MARVEGRITTITPAWQRTKPMLNNASDLALNEPALKQSIYRAADGSGEHGGFRLARIVHRGTIYLHTENYYGLIWHSGRMLKSC